MKNVTIKILALACIVSSMFACNNSGSAKVDIEQIKKEIQAKEDSFAAVYNSGQLRDIGYYAEDATSYLQNTAPLVGKPAIKEFLQSDLTGNTDKISFQTSDIYPSSDGEMVVEIGHFKVVDSANNHVNSGNYMALFQKRDGKYVVVRDMSTSDGVRTQI